MFIKTIITCIVLLLSVTACAPQKKVFFFEHPVPPQAHLPEVSQEFFDHPPLYVPKGKRKEIDIFSPNFTLAVPNAMDMTGRCGDLQKSIADILCTELYKKKGKRRIELLDRGALVNLDPKIILESLYREKSDSQVDNREKKKSESKNGTEDTKGQEPMLVRALEEAEKVMKPTYELKEYLKNADGILLVYITSRIGLEEGHFEVDYRIVINREAHKKIVLLAGSEKIAYKSNTFKQIEYERSDVEKIAETVYSALTLKNSDARITKDPMEMDIRIIKNDPPYIVIDIGRKSNLIPGMIGFVVERDNSVPSDSKHSDSHISYIAEFIVIDVFNNTSKAKLIRPISNCDVRVDDLVRIK